MRSKRCRVGSVPAACAPRVLAEPLESRLLLSTVVVNQTNDAITYSTTLTIPLLNALLSIAPNSPVTLRDAVIAANNTPGIDTINFAPGLAGQSIRLWGIDNLTFGQSSLTLTDTVVIDGVGAPGLTISRDTSLAPTRLRHFYVPQGVAVTIANLTLADGLAVGGDAYFGGGGAGLGGSIVNAGVLQLLGVTMTGNLAKGGGYKSSLVLPGGSYGVNAPAAGGGGLASDGQVLDGGAPNGGLHSTTIFNPAPAGFGGGGAGADYWNLSSNSGAPAGDGAFGGGGGASIYLLYYDLGSSNIHNVKLYGNGGFGGGVGNTTQASPGYGGGDRAGAGFGGAIFNYGGTLYVYNSTLTGNSAIGGSNAQSVVAGLGQGGAIFNLNGLMQIHDSTLANNIASDKGGAVFNLAAASGVIQTQSGPALPIQSALLQTSNTIYSGSRNSAGGLVLDIAELEAFLTAGVVAASTTNVIQTPDPANSMGSNVIVADPLLSSLASNGGPTQTMALPGNSPALNAGTSVAGITTDQRGITRPQGLGYDIGAFEIQANNAQLTGLVFEYETRQAVVLNFNLDARVTFARSSFTLTNVTAAQTVPASTGTFSFNASGTQATLLLTNLIPDANYSVTAGASTLGFFTLAGDANLDHHVNAADYSMIDVGFALHRSGYSNGDFNYSGTVNAADYSLIDSSYASHLLVAASLAAADKLLVTLASSIPTAAAVKTISRQAEIADGLQSGAADDLLV